LFQPIVRASINDQTVEWMKKLSPSELPYELFSDRNPLMQQVAQLAEQVRQQRQPVASDNPLLKWQGMVSDGIVAALDKYRDLRDSSMEKIFLAIYSSPALQAMTGVGTLDEPPRIASEIAPERAAFIKQRVAELKARIAEGGAREAAIRALLYIGMAGPGVDERAFNELRLIRAENDGLSLAEFKQMLREQYFSLLLDRDGALAAIPEMLPATPAVRTKMLDAIHRVVNATGKASGERGERLAYVETLFAGAKTPKQRAKPSRKVA
jgi:DNA-binding transcriptional MerR regulator